MAIATVDSYRDVYAVDTMEMGYPNRTAAYVVDAERPAIVDTGLSTGVDRIRDALDALNIDETAVEYLLLAHVHMDHAGGAGFLADACENATVVVHESGVDFVSDPEMVERLVKSVHRAVGDLAPMYGQMEPIPRDRIRAVDGGETVDLGSRRLEVVHAPGHAPHQVAFVDRTSDGIFVADECGEHLDGEVHPTTPPPDFDLDANLESLDRFRRMEPKRLFYPHFGATENAMAVIDRAESVLRDWVDAVDAARQTTTDTPEIRCRLSDSIAHYRELYDRTVAAEILRMDVEGALGYLEDEQTALNDRNAGGRRDAVVHERRRHGSWVGIASFAATTTAVMAFNSFRTPLSSDMVELVDLSGRVESGQPVYPGWQKTEIFTATTHEEFGYMNAREVEADTPTIERHLKAKRQGAEERNPLVNNLLISEHGPTHVDALSHLDPTSDGTIDSLPLDRFYGPAVCLDVSEVHHESFITQDDLQDALDDHGLAVQESDHVLLYTGHREANYAVDDDEKRYAYLYDYTGLDRAAARWLCKQGITNIGIDAPSIDRADAVETKKWPAHDMCAEYDVLNMENMANLGAVAGDRFTLAAFPLKIDGGTGSPIRPVAILDG